MPKKKIKREEPCLLMEGLPAVGLGRRDTPDIAIVLANDVKIPSAFSHRGVKSNFPSHSSRRKMIEICIFAGFRGVPTYIARLGLRRTTGGRRTSRVGSWRATSGSLRRGHLGSELSREESYVRSCILALAILRQAL